MTRKPTLFSFLCISKNRKRAKKKLVRSCTRLIEFNGSDSPITNTLYHNEIANSLRA